MDMERYLVEAHVREGRSVAELAVAHGVHRSWLYKLVARYREHGEAGLVARSRRPRTSPTQIGAELEEQILLLRKQLSEEGLDAGAVTIGAQVIGELPADDHPAVHVEDERDVQPATPGRRVRDVREPQLVRSLGDELTLDEVRRPGRGLVDDGGPALLSPLHTPDPQVGHESSDRAPRNRIALAAQCLVDPLNGTYKTELVKLHGPWRTRAELEIATIEWIDWYNERRLHGEIGDIPPAEHEATWYRHNTPAVTAGNH